MLKMSQWSTASYIIKHFFPSKQIHLKKRNKKCMSLNVDRFKAAPLLHCQSAALLWRVSQREKMLRNEPSVTYLSCFHLKFLIAPECSSGVSLGSSKYSRNPRSSAKVIYLFYQIPTQLLRASRRFTCASEREVQHWFVRILLRPEHWQVEQRFGYAQKWFFRKPLSRFFALRWINCLRHNGKKCCCSYIDSFMN